MTGLAALQNAFGNIDFRDLGNRQLEELRNGLRDITPDEITSAEEGKNYIALLRKFREAVAENDKFHGKNYPQLLNSLLSVGEDGLYSNSLRFIFELIQNVDDCDYNNPDDCKLDMEFDYNTGRIVLTYNEVGFTPFNVFAITGIAEAAKNVSAQKNEIGEKGIGFKSVFGVADTVLIRSRWFSFKLYKSNFTIPVADYEDPTYCNGTQMTLFVGNRAQEIYRQLKNEYCTADALFSKNPLLFLNKLTSLKFYQDSSWRYMKFCVSRTPVDYDAGIQREDNVQISVDLRDYDNGLETESREQIVCTRYVYPVVYSQEACRARYGEDTAVGSNGGKHMLLQTVIPESNYISTVGRGALYSFLPTQLKFTVPIVCHVPFKLDASREFVDPQGENLWFRESYKYLSVLLDYVYEDWAKTAKRNIVYYVPGSNESIIAVNNGKEKCLRKLPGFSGAHYLSMPLFSTTDGNTVTAREIFCFEPNENIKEPVKVSRMMCYNKALFIPPKGYNMSRFSVTIQHNVLDALFQRLLSNPEITDEALEYLDAVNYHYLAEKIPMQDRFSLNINQILAIMKRPVLANIFKEIACKAILVNQRPRFSVSGTKLDRLADMLGIDFDEHETPKQIERYLSYSGSRCVCLDIDEADYLPCYDAVVISSRNPLNSFASFCAAIDPRDTFSIRIKLQEASRRLDSYVRESTGTAEDFIRELHNIRLVIKDSLGKVGYQSYINLIIRSGTERKRFIQELLQNADDCIYPENAVPTFKLEQKKTSIVTEYNEKGFTRENIRAITAIGESTKARLIDGDTAKIGEKGIGFKTIFAIASRIRVSSGTYNFQLTDKEPTIPTQFFPEKNMTDGTRMELTLKDNYQPVNYTERQILELCLCLRNLKKLTICGCNVLIEDTDTMRTITVGKRKYSFKKYTHRFIADEAARDDREQASRKFVMPEQAIYCYIPERNILSEYYLYNGLPTTHKIRIPLVIDAPFELTTSREQIETDCAAWNNLVRKEMYQAITQLMLSLQEKERSAVLRFVRYSHRLMGKESQYINDISDCSYLTEFPFARQLADARILPTYDKSAFVSPGSGVLRYPTVANMLFDSDKFGNISPDSVLDIPESDYDPALKAFAVRDASVETVFPLLAQYAERYITDERFRPALYEYLQSVPENYHAEISGLAIIPVWSISGETTEYISWKKDSVFVKKNAKASTADYYILNENLLSKSVCEKMIGCNINEMSAEWEHSLFNEKLDEKLSSQNDEAAYYYLLAMYSNGTLKRNESKGKLLIHKAQGGIPLKNGSGEITRKTLFICDQPVGYFDAELLQHITVNRECQDFAEFINCEDLSTIHFEDISWTDMLTDDDIECLQDDYFRNSEEILRGFYHDGQISDDLLSRYDLEYLAFGKVNESEEKYTFPSVPVRDRQQLLRHVNMLLRKLIRIVPVTKERIVYMGQGEDSSELINLNYQDAREGVLKMYAPDNDMRYCFCQMCLQPKHITMIEVNNLQLKPQYYLPQMRVALCLNCSKNFEFIRNNANLRHRYLDNIKKAQISYEGKIEIAVGSYDKLTFTAVHLAEIQEILKQIPDEESNAHRQNKKRKNKR